MTLDPQAEMLLLAAARLPSTPIERQTPRQARAEMLRQTAALGRSVAVAGVQDVLADGPGGEIPIRVYTPGDRTTRGCLVYFHGGGFVIGSIETHDGMCRSIALAAGVVVASVDYRLAPEHKFPAAAEDAYAATCWIIEHAERFDIDERRIAVGGDSAGGNLATVAALMARDRGGPPLAFQLLLYPVTDADLERASHREYAEGYLLTRNAMAWFWEHYVSAPSDRSRPYAAPLRAEDLSRLPPALVITAECDPLRDEGEAYARRLEEAGVPVTLTRYPGMIHGFIRRANLLTQGKQALVQIAEALRANLT
jgi:acetyl esterase